MKRILVMACCLLGAGAGLSLRAQEQIYPKHFPLREVRLLDSPWKTAQERNIRTLLAYDMERLLTPFVRQAGLSHGAYAGWVERHPNFENWGGEGFDLSGHVGGHYLSALALACAATPDTALQAALRGRLDRMVGVLADCQAAYAADTTGLRGFIGGQPLNAMWQALYRGDTDSFRQVRGWVPFYCQHKVLAGLRDAWIYAGNAEALRLFRGLADWSVVLVERLDDTVLQQVLDTEHGGMNETLADAYRLLGEEKYRVAARRYSHEAMVDGMLEGDTLFLNHKHANTQVPKYIGFQRVAEEEPGTGRYARAARRFWDDVALRRTTCIGGNSVAEHFLEATAGHRYIDHLDGPETCNTNNMLKLSEMLSDASRDARYADFYEQAMLNHILSTQDPQTGGYVYFTTLRPQAYRIYSRPNEGMWCCVGTGMENHSKYGHFAYTRGGRDTLFVNLFLASRLENDRFVLEQRTRFPYEEGTTLTLERGGRFTLALRHPAWAGEGYEVRVNGRRQRTAQKPGEASYVLISRKWKKGDRVTVSLPMALRYTTCPTLPDYIAFHYGPVLLAAQTTAVSEAEAARTGLPYEALQNEYAGAGRMDHAPGTRATARSLASAPMLIGDRAEVLSRLTPVDGHALRFRLDVSRPGVASYGWDTLTLRPFHEIHHARYQCYWLQQTAAAYARSGLGAAEAAQEALARRTLDFVWPGEQQSEAGHAYDYSTESTTGVHNSERYRDAPPGGHIQYTLYNPTGEGGQLALLCRFTTDDAGRQATLWVDGEELARIEVPARSPGSPTAFYDVEYPLPFTLLRTAGGEAKRRFVVRLQASASTLCPGLYGLRLVRAGGR